jgi:hypothetical protein
MLALRVNLRVSLIRRSIKEGYRVILSRFRKALVGVVAAAIIAVPTAQTFAQQTNGSGLSISPTRTELSIKPGQAGTVSITIKNVTKGTVTAKALVNDFEADNTSGEPKLITDDTKRSSASIRDFLIGFDDVELSAGQEKEVVIPVQIPSDASPGAYYGVVRYQAIPKTPGEQGAGQVALTASVGSLVLIEVPGNITEKIQIENVKPYLNGKSGAIFTKKPKQVGVQIKNLGNSFAKPFGQVQVLNMTNKQVYAYELNNSTPRGNILPTSERTFLDDLKNIGMPGRYKISANISFGRGGEILNYETTFWYLPVWLLVAIAAILILLIVSALYMYRRYTSRSVSHRKK